ncbi:alpha/beta hydrolase family protein [Phenylobacterium sp.]|jgi:predicted dienelactone hydrolase|uniref:alpha/beta hydrolase family protein n=1 Tax=Phenylobacterium sp. TaxID=1871053 RepID=UPI002F41A594
MRLLTFLAAVAIALSPAAAALAQESPVGERHLEATNPTAALRDADHKPTVRITVWYPAAEGVEEKSLDLGPPGQAMFYVGSAAPDAPFADARRRPVILFSHGFGGTARMMGWFTTVLAQQGYVVIAVDHPGNNGADKMTVPGAALFWDRPGDLEAALERVKDDPAISPHLDLRRLAIAGFANGGSTALQAIGARVDLARFHSFCAAHTDDPMCRPQPEFPVTLDQEAAAFATPQLAAEAAHAGDDHSIRGVRAAFLMAPAFVQALDPASLGAINTPVSIVLGEADPVARPHTNGGVVARLIPQAQLKALPRVGHYDFLSACTPAAMQRQVPLCLGLQVPQGPTHVAALQQALIFFGRVIGPP